MTADAVEGGFALGVAIDAEAHVDFINWHDAIHRLDRSVAALALDSGVDMRVMRQADALCDSCSRQKLKTTAARSRSSRRAAAGSQRRATKVIRRDPATKQKISVFHE